MEPTVALIRVRGVPLELWLTLPFVVICLYLIFRWRKFGEDSFTWNHEYFKLACSIGAAVWGATFLATFLPEPWHIAVFWLVAFIGAVLALSYWGSQGLTSAAILSLFIIFVGVVSMPIPQFIRHFLFGTQEPARRDFLAGVPRRSFTLNLLDGWQELPGKSPRTYSRQADGSGVLQVSLQPALEHAVTSGGDAERELSELLDSIGKDMVLGQRVSVSHEECASGIMAFADYKSDQHGLMRFWLIPTEVTVFASYTDGRSTVSEREIAEAHKTLKGAKFE